jgi:hypothetical protein
VIKYLHLQPLGIISILFYISNEELENRKTHFLEESNVEDGGVEVDELENENLKIRKILLEHGKTFFCMNAETFKDTLFN